MGITHLKSNTIADFTGTVTVFNNSGGTTTAAASDLVRPSDWNSAHHIVFNLEGNTAGSGQVSGADITLVGGNNITLSADTALSRMVIIGTSGGGLTTAALSDHSHGNPQLNLTNLSGTTASNSAGFTLSLSAAAPGGGGVALSAGTQSVSTGTVVFANSNGLTFGMSGSNQITASHNGLTTARASNDAVGLNTALTAGPLAWTVNSAGISLNASSAAGTTSGFAGNLISGSMTHNTAGLNLSLNHPAWLTTAAQSNHSHGNPQLNLTNLSGTTASNSAGFTLSLSAAAGGGGADGYNILAAGTQTAATTGTVAFVNSNGITFGMSNSSQITASHNGLTSQTVQTQSNVQGISAGTQVGRTGDIVFADSNGISFGLSGSSRVTATYTVPSTAGLISAVNFSAGTTSGNLAAVTLGNANGISFGLNAGTLTASHNGLTSQSNQAVSGSNGSFTFQTVTFGALNGLTFYTSNGSLVGSHNALTTARASNDGVGLATAQTNVTWTVNSAGLSLNAAGYAGTGTTFNGTNISGSMTLNSAGLRLDASVAAPGGGGAVNFSAGTTSNNLQTVVFSNSNGVSFGLNGSTITASAAGGGGGVATLIGWQAFEPGNNTTFSSQGQNSLYLQKVRPWARVHFSNLEFRVSGSFVSSSNSQVVRYSIQYGLYSLDTAANSYNSLGTSVMVISASYNSNTAMGYTVSQGAGSFTTTSGGTVIASLMSGYKQLYLPFTSTLSEGVDYAVGLLVSSATTVNTGPMRMAFWNLSILNNLTMGKIHASTILASNSTFVGDWEQGVYNTTTGAMPAAVAKSQMTNAISRAILFHQFD